MRGCVSFTMYPHSLVIDYDKFNSFRSICGDILNDVHRVRDVHTQKLGNWWLNWIVEIIFDAVHLS